MDKARQEKKKYLFTVDILVEGYNNGIALETLLHLLNQDQIADYDIKKGIAIGKLVQEASEKGGTDLPIPDKGKKQTPSASVTPPGKSEPPKAAETKPEKAKGNGEAQFWIDLLEKYKQTNALVRLTVLKGKGIRLSVPCRILSFDLQEDSLTVYHVDEKKVYQFRLTEVEEVSI
ncbi:hypothetical protein [Gorillibacterium sp. CAU 1737]|uniref:hypothetical protein n=1 Tax=Gorillibacterium sp. CAU 1737 TaxID=3140362 RepID=UPI0032602D6C